MRISLAAPAAAIVILALNAGIAHADPTDPAPGWSTQTAEGYINAIVDGAGGVHLVERPEFDSTALLRHSTDGQWSSATQPEADHPLVATSSDDAYAVMSGERREWDNGIYHHQVVARVYTEGAWGPPVVVAEFDDANFNMRTWLDTNKRGDAFVAWSAYPAGRVHAAVLPRGGTWRTSTTPLEIDEATYLRFDIAQPVINNSGKVSLVWFQPTPGSTSGKVLRSVLPALGTGWTPPRPVTSQSVTDPARVDVDTDGHGRETVAAGSRVFRQVHTGSGFRYLFRATGARAVDIAASGPRTRLVWAVRDGRTFTLKSRLILDAMRPTAIVDKVTINATEPLDCVSKVEPAAGISLQGRSYLVWGYATKVEEHDGRCASSGFARALAVDGADRTVGSHRIRLVNGGDFRVSVTELGPVSISYLGSYQPGTGWGENHRAVFLSR